MNKVSYRLEYINKNVAPESYMYYDALYFDSEEKVREMIRERESNWEDWAVTKITETTIDKKEA